MGALEKNSSGIPASFFVFNSERNPVEERMHPFTGSPRPDRTQRTVDLMAAIIKEEILPRAKMQSPEDQSSKKIFHLDDEGFGPALAKLENALVSYFFHSKELSALISERMPLLESETFHMLKKELGAKHGAKTEIFFNQLLEEDSGRGILSMLRYLRTRTETLQKVCSSMEQKTEREQCIRYAISYNNDLDARYEVDAIETVYLLPEPGSSAIEKVLLCNLVQVKSKGFLMGNNLEISEEERNKKIKKIESAHQALLDRGFLPYDEIVRRKEMRDFETSQKIVRDRSVYAEQAVDIIDSILPNTPDPENISQACSYIEEESPSSPEEKISFFEVLLPSIKSKQAAEKEQTETNPKNIQFLEILFEKIREIFSAACKEREKQRKGQITPLSEFGSVVYVGDQKIGSKTLRPKENKETGLIHRFPKG